MGIQSSRKISMKLKRRKGMRKTKQAMAWLLISAMMGSQTIPAFAAPDVVEDQQVTESTSVETEEVDEPEAESKESMEETEEEGSEEEVSEETAVEGSDESEETSEDETVEEGTSEEETPEESSEDASEEETSEEETAEEETPEEETSEEETAEESVPGSVAETVPETSAAVLEEDPIIDMPDENLKKLIINDGFDKNGDGELSVSELEDLHRIDGNEKSIADLTGLEYAPNLTTLYLSFNSQLSDMSPLESASNLSELYVWGCNISDIKSLSGLINLRTLSIGGNHLSDISALKDLTNLEYLSINCNEITDVSPLGSLTKLRSIDAADNQITRIPDLSGLTNLELYYTDYPSMEKHPNNMFSGNMITRDEFVGKFAEEPGEDWLELNSYDETIVEIPDQALKSRLLARFDKNQDGELSKSEMSQIEYFDAYNAGITDLTGLEYATEISSLEVPYNGIKDLAPISKLPNLQYLNVKENQITKVPDFTETNLSLYDFVWDADKQEHVQTTPRNIFGGNQILKEQFVGKFATEPGEDWLALNSYDETIVEIPDQALKSRLLAQFDKNQDGELSKSEMSQIEYFDAYDAGITDLTGLEYVIGKSEAKRS